MRGTRNLDKLFRQFGVQNPRLLGEIDETIWPVALAAPTTIDINSMQLGSNGLHWASNTLVPTAPPSTLLVIPAQQGLYAVNWTLQTMDNTVVFAASVDATDFAQTMIFGQIPFGGTGGGQQPISGGDRYFWMPPAEGGFFRMRLDQVTGTIAGNWRPGIQLRRCV